MFALGLILCEMCSKFSTIHERIITLSELKFKGKLPAKMLSEFREECEIILMLVNSDPFLRPSAEELLASPQLERWQNSLANQQLSTA